MGLFGKKKDVWTEEKLAGLKWPKIPVSLTDKTIDEFLHSYPVVAIDFWAGWCAPCKKFGPKVRSLAKELEGCVAFGKLNTESYQAASKRFGVMSLPTLIVFKNGVRAEGIKGNVKWSEVEKMLGKYVG